ncbi:hypothetical protein [Leucobacter ruminantium]|uniref:Uncharacterized protein n=1 Tax=Leucobacter ruminantium TaxID=1289170 RepID=A0A939LZU9_9MICO|nr:hypothetical protein [Leucobacter ruminantium]MBO1804480.1 hypothetical protein [Leucobacter ruminantium]
MNADELDAAATSFLGPWHDNPATAITTAVELLHCAAHELRATERTEVSIDRSGKLTLICRADRRRREGISPGITLASLLRTADELCNHSGHHRTG